MSRFRDWVHAEAAKLLRPEFEAAHSEMHQSLHDATEALQRQIALEGEQTRHQMLEQQSELAESSRTLARSLQEMHARLDRQQLEQRERLQALEGSLRETTNAFLPPLVSRPTVLAGSIDPAPAPGGEVRREIDLTNRLGPGTRVEARSRFDATWFDDLEVAEIVEESDGERYRLTRRRDGRTLPMLFDAVELRRATTDSAASTAEPVNQ